MKIFLAQIQKLEVAKTIIHKRDGFVGSLPGSSVHNNADKSCAVSLCCCDKNASGSSCCTLTAADTSAVISRCSLVGQGKTAGKVAGSSGNIGSRYCIRGRTCDITETVSINSCLHDQCKIMSSSMLVVIRKTGRIGKYRVGTAQFLCAGVHLLHKCFYRSSDLFCNLKCDIIGRGQHNSIQALLHGKNFSKL